MSNLFRCLVSFTILCVLTASARADVFYDTYQHGLAAFKDKEYPNARAEFMRAYDLRPEPVILFNIAQTYRLEHNSEQALVYYKRFLTESDIAEDLRKNAQAYVTYLEAERAARDAQAKVDADVGPKERDGAPVKMAAPPMDRVSPPSSTMPPGDTASDITDTVTRGSDTRGNGKRKTASALGSDKSGPVLQPGPPALPHASSKLVPLIIGTGALALLGGGLGLELWAESKYDAAKSEMMSQLHRESLYNSANRKRYAAEAFAVSGIVAGGAAVWLYLRGGNRERNAVTDASMHVVPTATGLALSGQF